MPSVTEKVDAYIDEKGDGWKHEVLVSLRQLLSQCDVQEDVKWGAPTYVNNGNVVSFAAFKNHVALWFYQGVFLKDPAGLLRQTESKTEGLRQIHIEEGQAIDYGLLKSYVEESVENHKAGKKITVKKQKEVDLIPSVFQKALEASPKARDFFASLSISKKNEFIQHISQAKREETQQKRVQKSIEYLENGLDLNHKYRK